MRPGYGGVRGCIAHELSYRVMFFFLRLANGGSKSEAVVLMCGGRVRGLCLLFSSEMCCRWNLNREALYEKWRGGGLLWGGNETLVFFLFCSSFLLSRPLCLSPCLLS
jgi:hypothetical protein